MGGTIDVKSAKGRGTTFTVRLHLQEVSGQDAPAKAENTSKRSLAGKRALVCEDNALNLEIVRAILNSAGMEVTGAENGQIGLDLFKEKGAGYFDIILLDLRMPVMDGKTAARAIRRCGSSDASTIPIFAVSADAYPENVEECLEAGMNAHISKPVNAEELLNKITQFLDRE